MSYGNPAIILRISAANPIRLWGVAIMIAFGIVDHHSGMVAGQESGALPSDRLRDTVLLGIRTNDEKLGAVQIDIEDVTEDLTVTKREEVTYSPDSETTIVNIRVPRSVATSRVLLSGDNFKYEYLDAPEVAVSTAFAYDGTLWTELRNDGRSISMIVRRPEQMPRMLPLDPREVAVFDLRRHLSEMLATSTFKPRTAESSGQSDLCTAESTSDPGIARVVLTFDPSFAMLPIETVAYFPDQSVFCRTQIRYRKADTRDAWVLDQAETRQFPKGAATDPESPKFTKKWTKRVTNLKLLDDRDPAVFVIEPPAKHLFIDFARAGGKPIIAGLPEREIAKQRSAETSRLFIAFVLNGVLLAAICVILLLRRRRSRTG